MLLLFTFVYVYIAIVLAPSVYLVYISFYEL